MIRPLVFVVLAALSSSTGAWAHSVLLTARPAANSTISAVGGVEVSLRFDSRVDARRSSLAIELPDGRKLRLTPLQGDEPGTVKARADALPAGKYKIVYEVLSIDGHFARGASPFTVE
ncbi:MAG: copper resistance protein CopC [Alphaproteobacteria bacterium]|nr:copper resistance protein CopC [Alphaproteobacteria bacterium]